MKEFYEVHPLAILSLLSNEFYHKIRMDYGRVPILVWFIIDAYDEMYCS